MIQWMPNEAPFDSFDFRIAGVARDAKRGRGRRGYATNLIILVITIENGRVSAKAGFGERHLGSELVGPDALWAKGGITHIRVETPAAESFRSARVHV